MRFRLASLFSCTLGELDQRLSPEEWAGWLAYWQLEPWGCGPADQRAELIAQILFACNSAKDAEIPTFIDRDPKPVVHKLPTLDELEDSIKDWMFGRAVPAADEADPLSTEK